MPLANPFSAIAVSWFTATPDPGVVWATALIVGIGYGLLSARRAGIDQSSLYWAAVAGIVFGLWGGRLLGFIYYGVDGSPWTWLQFFSGGQVQYGNLIGGGLALALVLKLRKISFRTCFDAIAPALALAISIGRIGCFLNGDDFGALSQLPWAVRFPAGTEAYADHLARGWIAPTDTLSLPVHPVQLYSTLAWLGIFAILVAYRSHRPGLRLALFLALHGLGRFIEQWFRDDFQPKLGPLSITQLISLLFIMAAIALWLYRREERQVIEAEPDRYISAEAALNGSSH